MQKTTSINQKIEFIKSSVDNYRYSNGKEDIAIWCPFCQNSNKNKLKMILQVDKGIYHCWVCNSKGNNIPFLIKKINPSKYEESQKFFNSFKKKINDEWNLILNGLNDLKEEEKIIEKVVLPSEFQLCASLFYQENIRNPDIRDVMNYLKKRGCSEHKMWMLRFGISRNDSWRRMLIIPSFSKNGELNYFTCRKIDESTFSSTKYKNCDIEKKKIIFNEILIDWNQPLTLVEGPLDLLKTNDNSTCLLGSTLPKDSLLFKRIVENKTPIVLALDNDAYKKSLKIAEDLMQYDISVSLMDTSAAKDVGDMTEKMFEEYYKSACKIDQDDLLLNKIQII